MAVYQSQSPEEKRAVSTKASYARSLCITNVSGSTRYVWVFDNSSAATGTVLCNPVQILAGRTVSIVFEPTLLKFSNGMYVAASSTQSTYTATSAADFMIHADIAPQHVVTMKPVRQAQYSALD